MVVPMLHAQHGFQRVGPSSVTRVGVNRLDAIDHVLPRRQLLRVGQENFFSGLTELAAEFTVGEGELMTHDAPRSVIPDGVMISYQALVRTFPRSCRYLILRYSQATTRRDSVITTMVVGNTERVFAVPLNETVMKIIRSQTGRHETHKFSLGKRCLPGQHQDLSFATRQSWHYGFSRGCRTQVSVQTWIERTC